MQGDDAAAALGWPLWRWWKTVQEWVGLFDRSDQPVILTGRGWMINPKGTR